MDIRKIVDEIELSTTEYEKFKSDINNHKFSYMKIHGENQTGEKLYQALYDLFVMRFKLNLSTTDIGEYFGLEFRSIQYKMKRLGWERDRYEAQSIATTKRDYKAIKSKSIGTMLQKNTMSTGSEAENYIRHMINQLLTSKLKCEVVVGLNNRTILEGLEIDIPIIIINHNKIYRYAIEVDGVYWHKNEVREKRKELALQETEYKYIKIEVSGTVKNSKAKLNEQINNIVDMILKEVDKASFFNTNKDLIP